MGMNEDLTSLTFPVLSPKFDPSAEDLRTHTPESYIFRKAKIIWQCSGNCVSLIGPDRESFRDVRICHENCRKYHRSGNHISYILVFKSLIN